jgi:hypothetical protein
MGMPRGDLNWRVGKRRKQVEEEDEQNTRV